MTRVKIDMETIEQLQDELKAAAMEVNQWENRKRNIPRELTEIEANLEAAVARRDAALTKLRELQPIPLPPIPSFEQMMTMARSQCRDRDERQIKSIVGRISASATCGVNTGTGREIPAHLTGDEVRDVTDSNYDLTGPPADAQPGRYHKSYG